MKDLGMNVLCLGLVIADVSAKLKYPHISLDEDLVLVDEINLFSGGNALNTALALSKLGMNTGISGKVGCDYFGHFLIKVMQEHGCDIRGIIKVPDVNTSVTIVLVRSDGQRNFLHYSAASSSLNEEDVDFSLISQTKILHIAGTFLLPGLDGEPMANILRKAQKRKVMTSLDVAWDPYGKWMQKLEPCLSYVDIFLPNYEEGRRLTGKKEIEKIADALLSYGIRIVGLKLGEKGCYLKTSNEEFMLPSFKVKSVDLTGAGDSFVAGFLTGISKGFSIEKSGMLANAVGAMCVSSLGATAGVKDLKKTLEFMTQSHLCTSQDI